MCVLAGDAAASRVFARMGVSRMSRWRVCICFGTVAYQRGILMVSALALLPRVETLTAISLILAVDLAIEIVRLRSPSVNDRFIRMAARCCVRPSTGRSRGRLRSWPVVSRRRFSFPYPLRWRESFSSRSGTPRRRQWVSSSGGPGSSQEPGRDGGFPGGVGLVSLGVTLFSSTPPFGALVAGAVTAAAVELLPLPVDDNFTIPVASAAVMHLLS